MNIELAIWRLGDAVPGIGSLANSYPQPLQVATTRALAFGDKARILAVYRRLLTWERGKRQADWRRANGGWCVMEVGLP
jgi:hypothetical protein